MEVRACYLGSVNRWECDENDHLNVRFYAQKINQAVAVFLETAAVAPAGVQITGQHIRFVNEARIAAPLRVDCSLLAVESGRWRVLSLMWHNLQETPVAGFITELAGPDLVNGTVTEPAAPEWAAPRGLSPEDPYPAPDSLAAAEAAGFRMMGRGRIGTAECDSRGQLLPEIYIGRLSDGMPNFWGFTTDAEEQAQRQSGALGGAVLEYRLDVLEPLKRDDVFRHLSGIRDVGNKTQHMVHLLINERADRVALRAEAIGVGMDLESRRAVPISDSRRVQLEALRLG